MNMSYNDNLIYIEALKLYKKDLQKTINKAKKNETKYNNFNFSWDLTKENKEILNNMSKNNKYKSYINMLNNQLEVIEKEIKSALRYKYKLNKENKNKTEELLDD